MTRNPDQRRHGDLAVREWQRRTNLVLISCLASTIIYLVEKIIIQIVTVAYRRRQSDYRIKTYKNHTLHLSKLYEASCKKFPREEKKFKQLDNIIKGSGGSGTPMDDIFGDINSFGYEVTRTFRQVMREVTGKENARNQGESYQIVSKALEEKKSAEALAEWIWELCTSNKTVGLTEGDLLQAMGQKSGGGSKKEVSRCFSSLVKWTWKPSTPLRVKGHKSEEESKQKEENKQEKESKKESNKEVSEYFSSLDRDRNTNVSLDEMVQHVANLRKEKRGVEKSWQSMVSKIYITQSPPAISNQRA